MRYVEIIGGSNRENNANNVTTKPYESTLKGSDPIIKDMKSDIFILIRKSWKSELSTQPDRD